MPFRFSLQPVLRFRASLERQRELVLQEANQKTSGVRRQIENLVGRLAENAATSAREMQSGTNAAQLHFEMLCRSILLEHRHGLETELAQCEQAARRCSLEYRQARIQREMIERLRDHRLAAYRREEMSRQQQWLDELFLLRREYLRQR